MTHKPLKNQKPPQTNTKPTADHATALVVERLAVLLREYACDIAGDTNDLFEVDAHAETIRLKVVEFLTRSTIPASSEFAQDLPTCHQMTRAHYRAFRNSGGGQNDDC